MCMYEDMDVLWVIDDIPQDEFEIDLDAVESEVEHGEKV